MSRQKLGRYMVPASVALSMIGLSAATAATISVGGLLKSYYSTSATGPFVDERPGTLYGDGAVVGHFGAGTTADGYYASLIQFALPTLPATAIVKTATLNFPFVTGSLGDTAVMAYATKSPILDPGQIGKGSSFATISPYGSFSFDLTDIVMGFYTALPGYSLGFSFRQVTENCRYRNVYGTCDGILGYTSPGEQPTLAITYDIMPPLTSGVPEPASWMLGVCGFGVIGATLRVRRRPFVFHR